MDISTMLSTAEMAIRHGVSLRTLRFYEQSGLLEPSGTGRNRFYAPKDQMRLEVILKGKRLGFSLQEIRKLIEHAGSPEEDDTSSISTLENSATARHAAHEDRKAETEKVIDERTIALVQKSAVA